jgi:hypothetical protein
MNHPSRRLPRVARLAVALAGLILLTATPLVALASRAVPASSAPVIEQALDLSTVIDAIQRGELTTEVLLVLAGAAIAAGLLLMLGIAGLRSWRRRRAAEKARSEREAAMADVARARAAARGGAPTEEAWAPVPGARVERDREAAPAPAAASPVAPADVTDAWQAPRAPEWRVPAASRDDGSPVTTRLGASSELGTQGAPLIVEVLNERRAAPPGPNLSVLIAIATVAVGLAFAGGAIVGAALGTTLGATIGIAFAGGAGTAIGTTLLLLRGRRR